MPTCVVPGCTSGYPANRQKVHFFTVPADPNMQRLWKDAIKHDSVKARRAVCEKHFRKDEILWQRKFISPHGDVVGVGQYKVPRLRKGSVPSRFPWTENPETDEEPSEKEENEPSPCNVENVSAIETVAPPSQEEPMHCSSDEEMIVEEPPITFGRRSPRLTEHTYASPIPVKEKQQNKVPSKAASPEIGPLTFEELLGTEVPLPPGWIKFATGCSGKSLIMFYTNQTVQVEETYDIFPLKNLMIMEDMSIQLKVVGFLYKPNEPTLPSHATDIKELQDMILRVHRLSVCHGITNTATFELDKKYAALRKDASDTWRHSDCLLLLLNKKVCVHCRTAKSTVSRFQRRQLQREAGVRKKSSLGMVDEKRQVSLLHMRYRAALRAKRRMREKLKVLHFEVVEIRDRLRKCSNKDLEEHVKNGNIPQNYLHVVDQIMEAVKHKNSKGKNYSEEWMLLCRLLHSRSPSGYDFLRSNNILPLPCIRTIQRYLS